MDPADQLEDVAWYKQNNRYVRMRTHSIHTIVISARAMTKRSADVAFARDDSGPSHPPIYIPNAPRLMPLQTPAWHIPFLDIGPAARPEHLAVLAGQPVLQDNRSVLLLGQWESLAKRP